MCDMHARIMAYDLLGSVAVVASVRDLDCAAGDGRRALETSVVIQGEGIDEPRQWLKDALIALLETL